jgi:hypothetical protein
MAVSAAQLIRSSLEEVRMPILRTLAILALATSGCGNGVSSNDDARKAYLSLDPSVDKAITLGFDGFNSASSANISPQMAAGTKSGSLTVTGQVDQGSSSNKTMRLQEAMVNYSDDGLIAYATSSALPALNMDLKSIPNGTVSGTLAGTFIMTGQESGSLDMNLSFTGDLQPDPMDATKVERKPGTTHITGTATSGAGTYQVDVTK